MACTFSTSQLPKVVPDSQLFNTFDFQTRHKDVHFLNISTAQSAPRMVCFFKFLGKIIDGSKLTCISLDPLMLLSRNSFAENSRSSADNPCTCRQRPKIWSSGHRIPRGKQSCWCIPLRVRDRFLFTFWLRNALRATTTCIFSTNQFPKALQHWSAFCTLSSTCASHHNAVHFLNS